MKTFRRKPLTVEATQFDGTFESGAQIVRWALSCGVSIEYHPFLADHFKGDPQVYVAHPDPFLRIPTLEGTMIAKAGDWVIRGTHNEFYPCKPEIFRDTYELIGE